MNKIEAAVLPLKQSAIERAEQEAKRVVEQVTDALAAAGNDLQVCAPYPSSVRDSRNEYLRKAANYKLYRMLCKLRDINGCRRHGDPQIADVCPELVERFIKITKEDAAIQYDAFVAKLVEKVGKATDATIFGDHVWGFSVLTVTKEDGSVEKWKTQMIINRSALGKLFNQFPTRKVKK